ncbi:MAG: cupin domain-containing protein [Bryobacteraceae bacterium]
MNKLTAFALGCAATLGVTTLMHTTAFAQNKVSPVRFDRDKIAGIGLTAVPPDAYKDILVGGQLNMRVATLFDGKELRASVFESTPAKTDHRTRPNDTDEFVFVQSGKLILTEPGGTVHEFRPGDTLMLPLGYTGTWEMQGNYREIAVTMKKSK